MKALKEHFTTKNRKLQQQLQEALSAAVPVHARTVDTPLHKYLEVLDSILEGKDVDRDELMDAKIALTSARNVHQPQNLESQLQRSNSDGGLDADVTSSLVQLLSPEEVRRVRRKGLA